MHAYICRLAETKPAIFSHRTIIRRLERQLILALVDCFNQVPKRSAPRNSHAKLMVRFETFLATHCHQPLRMRKLCAAIRASERTLRVSCAEFLGMCPHQYIQLRRLKMVRTALRRADHTTTSVSGLARRYGFTELGRFASIYRNVFGEMPSITLRRDTLS
jgi:AraC-like DNA-binding protein